MNLLSVNNPLNSIRKLFWLDIALASATGLGVGVVCYTMGDPWCGARWLVTAARSAYATLGFVVVGIIPLATWAVVLATRQILRGSSDRKMELDYGYISRTAPLLGLLGTVISLALATSQLQGVGSKVGTEAILRIIPLTGQALTATIAGLLIALLAETALHVIERKQSQHVERV